MFAPCERASSSAPEVRSAVASASARWARAMFSSSASAVACAWASCVRFCASP